MDDKLEFREMISELAKQAGVVGALMAVKGKQDPQYISEKDKYVAMLAAVYLAIENLFNSK